MKTRMITTGLYLGVGLLWSGEAGAALYCAVDWNGRRCQFVDLASCQQAVGAQGSCVLNREELMAPKGGAPFCLAEPRQTECLYNDQEACEKVAAPRKATCIANPNVNRDGVATIPDAVSGGSERDDPRKGHKYLPSPDYFPAPGRR
ncbi:MAG: hypothetical protein HQL78_10275 [Magnetococcales bacterium]|nr:hypothetical protein [Magnetococcales bacterium]MBF0420538.1 hypothetical protein [Magnetococcales bacterium]